MAVEDILVHLGTPFRTEEGGTWIEGERDATPTRLTPFACWLSLNQGTETPTGPTARQVSQPLLLYGPLNTDGLPVELGPNDQVYVLAPELAPWTGDDEVLWEVDGMPEPSGHPGDTPIVIEARLTKVRD